LIRTYGCSRFLDEHYSHPVNAEDKAMIKRRKTNMYFFSFVSESVLLAIGAIMDS